jgi:hypothetical protein
MDYGHYIIYYAKCILYFGHVMHLPELVAVGMIGFAGQVKGRQNVALTA